MVLLKMGAGGVVGEERSMGAVGFVALVCVWVYVCCSELSLCQALHGDGSVYTWHSRLVSWW
jgi:hypothetical protein